MDSNFLRYRFWSDSRYGQREGILPEADGHRLRDPVGIPHPEGRGVCHQGRPVVVSCPSFFPPSIFLHGSLFRQGIVGRFSDVSSRPLGVCFPDCIPCHFCPSPALPGSLGSGRFPGASPAVVSAPPSHISCHRGTWSGVRLRDPDERA